MNINIICREYSWIYSNYQIFATLCSALYIGHKLTVNILHHLGIYIKHLVSTYGSTLFLCIQMEVGSEKKTSFTIRKIKISHSSQMTGVSGEVCTLPKIK